MKYLLLIASLALVISSANAWYRECPGEVEESKPERKCDMCNLLFKADSDFMKNCGCYLDPMTLEYLHKACDKIKHDKQQWKFFLKNLNSACMAKGKSCFRDPVCECDMCELLFDRDSDFMQNCGRHLDRIILNKIQGHCEEVKDDEGKYQFFVDNLVAFCKDKNLGDYPNPECRCDRCWLLFNDNSQFMKGCGTRLDPMILGYVMKACERLKHDDRQYEVFVQNLQLACREKHLVCFELDECTCDLCDLLFTKGSDFMTSCGRQLDPLVLTYTIKQCRRMHDLPEQLPIFLSNLKDFCLAKDGCFTPPNCVCDPCDLYFDQNSDFMKRCGCYMDPLTLTYLRKACDAHKRDEDKFTMFIDNLKFVCCNSPPDNFHRPICGCDDCWELFKPQSEFMESCGQHWEEQDILDSEEVCLEIKKDPEQLKEFYDGLQDTCVDMGHGRFDTPLCDCDVCVELGRKSSDFMQVCAPTIDPVQVAGYLDRCDIVKSDVEALWELLNIIQDDCLESAGSGISLPRCDCEVCAVLFQQNSDFMLNCGYELDDCLLHALMKQCEYAKCDAEKLSQFRDYLDYLCEHFNMTVGDMEICECDECLMLFAENSPFMQGCGSMMSEEELEDAKCHCFSGKRNRMVKDVLREIKEWCVTTHEMPFRIPVCEHKGKGKGKGKGKP